MKMIIRGGTVLPMDEQGSVRENATVVVEDGRIVAIVEGDGPSSPDTRIVDAKGCLVLPGFINGHTHAGMTCLRGIADDKPLFEWLEEGVFPLEREFGDKDGVYLSTRLAALEMIRGGTTLANDMYYHEAEAARAFQDCGMRAIAGQTFVDVAGVDDPKKLLASLDEFLAKVEDLPLILPALTPHSVYGLPEALWREIIAYARDKELLVHTHLSETVRENTECREKYGKSPTQVLRDWGLWEIAAVAAHATHVNDEDIELLADWGIGVIHNPESNLKLAAGIAPVTTMRQAGMAVGLGTDSSASNNDLDMISEASTCAKLQAFVSGPGELAAKDVVRMMTIEGAKALRLEERIGSLESGKCADIVVLDVTGAHATPLYDPFSHIVYAAKGSDVRHTIVDGKVLMEDRKIVAFDEKEVLAEAREMGKRIQAFVAGR